ncbi:MAG: FecR family protein [Butyricimonas faecihominis]
MRTDQQTLIVESNTIKTRETEYYTINIPYGAEYNLVLSDGSKIYLNAGSTLRYPDQFIGDKREVFLTGEAYFEVKSDSLHPFIVHASDVAIRVLGTSFNVNAYAEGTWVKTTLVEGGGGPLWK